MIEMTLSRLQTHSRQRQKALRVGLGEDRKQGGGLGSCSSSTVQVGDYDMNTQESQIWGGIQQVHTPATLLLPGLPHCTAGWVQLGHAELSSTMGRNCQHAVMGNTSVGNRETGVLWATHLFPLFSVSLAPLDPLLPASAQTLGRNRPGSGQHSMVQGPTKADFGGFPCDFSDSLTRRQSCNAAQQQS